MDHLGASLVFLKLRLLPPQNDTSKKILRCIVSRFSNLKHLVISLNEENCKNALRDIAYIVREIEVDKFYVGTVKRILDFGAIVGLSPTLDGLIHISELAKERVKQVSDILNEGDEVLVKCISKERDGKIRLSRKAALDEDIDNYREI